MTKTKSKSKPKKKEELKFEMIMNEPAPAVPLYGDPEKWNNEQFKNKVHAFKEFILYKHHYRPLLGLAANQAQDQQGVRLDEPFIGIRTPNDGCNIYIDPVINEYIGISQSRQEHPMTHPKHCIVVGRYNKIIASWYNPMGGARRSVELEGLLAQAFQHLTDQINGFKYDLLPYGHIHSGNGNARRNDPCPCGSNSKTKKCCGVVN